MRADPLRTLSLGLVGAGWAGREHCRSVAAIGGAGVRAVVDVDEARARALAQELGAVAHRDLDGLLADEELEAIVVATPPGDHREPAVGALERGLGVFIEKPIARTADDATAIVAAARRTGGVCAVGYQWRAMELLGALRSSLEGREVALIVSQGIGITQARDWFTDSRQSGRLISERASHHIDLQRAIAGEVVAVQAMRGGVALSGRAAPDGGAEDVVSLTLEFASGAIGAIHVGWTPEGARGRQQLALYATGASFDIALDPAFELGGVAGNRAVRAGCREHPFRRELRMWLDAVRAHDRAGVACTAEAASGSLTVALVAERVIATGETGVVGPMPHDRSTIAPTERGPTHDGSGSADGVARA